MNATVFQEIRRVKPLIKETEARTLLGRFLFSGDDVFKRVGDLSGGERSRVALAQLTLMSGNLLVLDEPTNHLDINAREALEVVLNEYNGSILFVSHDRYFIDAVADTIWMVKDGTIEAFNGTYSEYAEYREAKERAPVADERRATKDAARPAKDAAQATNAAPAAKNGQHTAASNGSAPATSPKQPISGKEQSKEERKRQRKLTALEEEIAMLEGELKQLTEDITAAGVQGDGKRVKALEMQYSDVQEMLNSRYEEWSAMAR
jgi:ATP-binding cassette subfamily F protein 3